MPYQTTPLLMDPMFNTPDWVGFGPSQQPYASKTAGASSVLPPVPPLGAFPPAHASSIGANSGGMGNLLTYGLGGLSAAGTLNNLVSDKSLLENASNLFGFGSTASKAAPLLASGLGPISDASYAVMSGLPSMGTVATTQSAAPYLLQGAGEAFGLPSAAGTTAGSGGFGGFNLGGFGPVAGAAGALGFGIGLHSLLDKKNDDPMAGQKQVQFATQALQDNNVTDLGGLASQMGGLDILDLAASGGAPVRGEGSAAIPGFDAATAAKYQALRPQILAAADEKAIERNMDLDPENRQTIVLPSGRTLFADGRLVGNAPDMQVPAFMEFVR